MLLWTRDIPSVSSAFVRPWKGHTISSHANCELRDAYPFGAYANLAWFRLFLSLSACRGLLSHLVAPYGARSLGDFTCLKRLTREDDTWLTHTG